ncbi:MAG: hypothetical protein FJX35_18260, partial [Alphaproteobacteria bacterium]|nr:hypothetical protein [Alphaproteobacteria bacterium]
PSSLRPLPKPQRAICCRIFTPAQPDNPAASVRDFCSGAYTRLAKPDDIARHVLLHSIRRPSDWQQWFDAAGIPDCRAEQGMTFENSTLTYQGAVDGLGVAMAQFAFAVDDLLSGRLVAPLDIRVPNPIGYHLVFPAERVRVPKIRAFQSWIAEEAEQTRKSDAWL